MNRRLVLAGVTLLAVVTAETAGAAAPPILYKAPPPSEHHVAPPREFVGSAKPKNLPASATENDVLFQRFLDWRKNHPQ
jgi:hypothetical protein